MFFKSFPFHRADTVPVVMSPPRAIYEQVVPEGSFIHVDDFATPRDLGQHLNTIYENDAVFNKYLSWKGTGQFVKTWYGSYLNNITNILESNNQYNNPKCKQPSRVNQLISFNICFTLIDIESDSHFLRSRYLNYISGQLFHYYYELLH